MSLQSPARVAGLAGLLSVALLATSATPSSAARWTRATPFGGTMTALAQAPSAPRILYAVAQPGRVFRSLDGGSTWNPRGVATPSYIEVVELLVDARDPQTVYARTNGSAALLRTSDGGRGWSQVGTDLPAISMLVPDREQPGVLYAATRSGIYRSPDGGDTWSLWAFEGESVHALAIDPRDPASWLAAVGGEDFVAPMTWKSTDHGATWAETSRLGTPQALNLGLVHFVFDPARPETAYAFFIDGYDSGQVLRSTDGGVSWEELAASGFNDLAASQDGVLFAATAFGVARSTDRGDTWSPPLPPFNQPQAAPEDTILHIVLSTSAPGELFAAGRVSLWKSETSGASWKTSSRGIVALRIASLAAAPTGSDALVAVAGNGMYRDGVFRSTDRGGTWALIHTDVNGRRQPFVITGFDPRQPETVYGIGTDGQADTLLRSTDGGDEWTRLPVPYSCGGSLCDVSIRTAALDPRHPETVFVAGSHSDHFVPQEFFLLRSDDGFATWDALTPRPNLVQLIVSPERSTTLYGLTCGHLYRSLDAGATWEPSGRGLPRHLCAVGPGGASLALDPQDPRRMYVGTAEKGVYASSDGGATFQPMNRGLESGQVVTLLVDPSDPTRLYAGAALRGVFQWNSDRRRWLPLNQGLPVAKFEGVITLDPQHPSTLYAGTVDQGAFRLDVGEAGGR